MSTALISGANRGLGPEFVRRLSLTNLILVNAGIHEDEILRFAQDDTKTAPSE